MAIASIARVSIKRDFKFIDNVPFQKFGSFEKAMMVFNHNIFVVQKLRLQLTVTKAAIKSTVSAF